MSELPQPDPLPLFQEEPFPEVKVGLKSEHEVTLPSVSKKDAEREQLLIGVLKAQREELYKGILNELIRAQDAEIDRIESAQKQKLDVKKKQEIDKVYGKAHAILVRYSDAYGKALYRLAALEGFPDPDPNSFRRPNPNDKKSTKQFEEAKELRATLKTLDDRFYKDFYALLEQVKQEIKEDLSGLEKSIERLQKEARQKAETEAKALTADQLKGLKVQQVPKLKQLPALLGSEVTISSEQINLKRVEPPAAQESKEMLIKQLDAQVQLWAKLNGYRLSKEPSKSTDKTVEFIKWRNQYELELK